MHSKIKPVYIKVIGDAILPLLGYFLWDWNLYFILVFYLLDLLVGEVLVHLKTRKIKSYSEKVLVQKWISHGLLSATIVLIALIGIHLSMRIIDPTIDFSSELYLFVSYKEMGVAQGYILLPLIIFMGYSQYKNEFLLPKKYRVLEFTAVWKKHLLSRMLMFVFLIILTLIATIIVLPAWFYVLTIVIATSAFQLRMDKVD